MASIVKQSLYISKFELTGYFNYRNYFQLLPFPVKEQSDGQGHSIILLQIVEDTERLRDQANPDYRDTPIALMEHSIEERTIFQLLKFFLREDLCNYGGPEKWFHFWNGKEFEVHWGTEGYYGTFEWQVERLTDTSTMEACATAPADTYYHREYPDMFESRLVFPDNFTELFDHFYRLPEPSQKTFSTAINLFNQSIDLWDSNPSIAIVSMASAIETLLPRLSQEELEDSKCGECNQTNYKPAARFRKFLKHFGSKDKKFDELREWIYNFRSRYVHAGDVLKHELYGYEESNYPFKDEHYRRTARNFIRICILNWLIEHPSQAQEG